MAKQLDIADATVEIEDGRRRLADHWKMRHRCQGQIARVDLYPEAAEFLAHAIPDQVGIAPPIRSRTAQSHLYQAIEILADQCLTGLRQ